MIWLYPSPVSSAIIWHSVELSETGSDKAWGLGSGSSLGERQKEWKLMESITSVISFKKHACPNGAAASSVPRLNWQIGDLCQGTESGVESLSEGFPLLSQLCHTLKIIDCFCKHDKIWLLLHGVHVLLMLSVYMLIAMPKCAWPTFSTKIYKSREKWLRNSWKH